MLLVEKRLSNVRALVLEYLRHQDGTHTSIADGTGQCHSSISQVLLDLHTERLIHIGSWTKKSSRHRYVRTWRIGAGVDATMSGLDTALQQNAAAVLALLETGDMTRRQISAALGWATSNTWNVMSYMRDNDMIHMCGLTSEPTGGRSVHVYRAGAAPPGFEYKPAPRKKRERQVKPPSPTIDPIMAAFFGR